MANRRKNPFHSGFKGIWTPAPFYKLGLSPIMIDIMSYIMSFEAIKANEKINKKARAKIPCFASDAFLADLFDVGTATVARAIANLKELGYITVKNPNLRKHELSINRYNVNRVLRLGRKEAKQRYINMIQKRQKKKAQTSIILISNMHQNDSKHVSKRGSTLNNTIKDTLTGRASALEGAGPAKGKPATVENVFITYRGQKTIIYRRPARGSREWLEQQKQILGIA